MKAKKATIKSGLPVKYYLGLQAISPGYPSQDDFVFECINHVALKDKKNLGVEKVSFSKGSLKEVFGERLQDQTFLKSLKELIKTMIESGKLIKPDEDTLVIPKETFSHIFSIG
jgi:hypothetical protein